ncbi:hypothetical protein CFC21_106231 [Triticum aestivum]|uniref:PGG domain-containing protein n=2 Tax=Triticum aestivum TaxID=4565 RepID=A0A3B6SQT8_WHEAT|nr:hypothetical protein CFC21_106231 [Triticum aestivum]
MAVARTARGAADRCVAARADAAAAGDDVADAAAGLALPLAEAPVAVLAVPLAPAAAGADQPRKASADLAVPLAEAPSAVLAVPLAPAAAGANRPGKAAADLAVALAEAGLAVPLAHAAASKAREAAAGCDLALADAIEDVDKEFVDKMRGWLMTVATLFVGIAFQALLHPPDGMSFDSILVSKNAGNWKADPGAPSPAPNLAPSSASTVVNATSLYESIRACLYLTFNTSIMVLALIVLVSLLTMKKVMSSNSLRHIKAIAMTLATAVVGSVVTGTSRNLSVQLGILVIFGIYVFVFLLIPSIFIS